MISLKNCKTSVGLLSSFTSVPCGKCFQIDNAPFPKSISFPSQQPYHRNSDWEDIHETLQLAAGDRGNTKNVKAGSFQMEILKAMGTGFCEEAIEHCFQLSIIFCFLCVCYLRDLLERATPRQYSFKFVPKSISCSS